MCVDAVGGCVGPDADANVGFAVLFSPFCPSGKCLCPSSAPRVLMSTKATTLKRTMRSVAEEQMDCHSFFGEGRGGGGVCYVT